MEDTGQGAQGYASSQILAGAHTLQAREVPRSRATLAAGGTETNGSTRQRGQRNT